MNIFFCHYRSERIEERKNFQYACDSLRMTRKSQNSSHSDIESIY